MRAIHLGRAILCEDMVTIVITVKITGSWWKLSSNNETTGCPLLCGSRKYPYPTTEGIGNSRGVGGLTVKLTSRWFSSIQD